MKVTLLPGDGIGPEISTAVTSILAAAGAPIEWERHDAGEEALRLHGDPLPPTVVAAIQQTGVCLKGPVGTPIGRGFKSVNVDLIYGLPHQTEEGFASTIAQTLSLVPDRVAVYGYAHVPWLKHQQKSFEKALPGAEQKARLYLIAHRQFVAAGYVAIGMDHFARHDDELALVIHRPFP